jgi:alkanesulfonate monooxygenase SsuD/methylene tetrahydromethanopterin reductase-like flavin-dependent oxidoreductase (luciferase family)
MNGTSVTLGFKTSPQAVDWPTLDATWQAAGELDVFDAAWLNDHISHPALEAGGSSWEAVSLAGALAHHVPGKWVGHVVLANTFRHPVLLAKAATVLDHVTGGRFILGLGAGWHAWEHSAFGIPLPPIGERISRLESAVAVCKALFSPEASALPGVTLDDPFYPLTGATNEPQTLRPGGPPIWLGGQRRRGIALAAAKGDGWFMPGDRANDVDYLRERRDAVLRALEAAGRADAVFDIAGQITCGTTTAERREALDVARRMIEVGATHLILGIAASAGPDVLRAVAREVAEPLRATAT